MAFSNKGRCNRCCLSYRGRPEGMDVDRPIMNVCFEYNSYCNRVARNCTQPSGGAQRKDIRKWALKKLDRLVEKYKGQ